MQPQEKKRFRCSNCDTEFEITLEPRTQSEKETKPKFVGYCPFCRDIIKGGESN